MKIVSKAKTSCFEKLINEVAIDRQSQDNEVENCDLIDIDTKLEKKLQLEFRKL